MIFEIKNRRRVSGMKLDLATATAQEIKVAKGLYPVAMKFYLVALWDSRGRRWKLRRAQWDSLLFADRNP